MKSKIAWLVIGCLMAVALVLASCRPAAVEEEGERVVGKVVEKEEVVKEKEEVVVPKEKGPQYGGTLTALHIHSNLEPASWDPADCNWIVDPFTSPYLETLVEGDLTKGPKGTNEFAFQDMEYIPDQFLTGWLAESYELADPTTIVYHIRRGVYFPDKPGVMTSREMTADDVAFCLNRLYESPKAAGYYAKIEGATVIDKYTVEVKLKEFDASWPILGAWGYFNQIYPREVVDAGISDWRNAVGTGPFILTDYVSGASLTFAKNPLYWGTTTINGKEYKLPFVDRMVWPIIPDESTRLAALRTGKADIHQRVTWKYVESLEESNPELLRWQWLAGGAGMIAARMDAEPFDDIRIRRTLNMAIDRKAMIDSLYGGYAEMLTFPFSKMWPTDLYTPIEELPEEARELFEYNPEKASQLLAEAGYPDGFKTEVVCTSAQADTLSLVADYWKQNLGVELEIKTAEYGTYYSIMRGKTFNQMYYMAKGNGDPTTVLMVIGLPGQYWNPAMFDDEYFTETYWKMRGTVDTAERKKLLKELNVYIIKQTPYIIMPSQYYFCYAWPWVKNYHGELSMGKRRLALPFAHVWIDQELKKEMGY